MSRISIVIPTLNEASSLERTLAHLSLLNPPAWEIIIVDGGSEDETVALAERTSKVLPCSTQVCILTDAGKGRAIQMNRGAEAATGEMICFLHADTTVPDDMLAVIEQTLSNQAIACGGFISLMTGFQTTRWGISLHNYLKTYYAPLIFHPHLFFRGLRILFGDQVIFTRLGNFWDCGGFDSTLSIMEEADLCLRLVRWGRICQVNRIVQSSDRRVTSWGGFKATLVYLYIGFCWGLGFPTSHLKRVYKDIR